MNTTSPPVDSSRRHPHTSPYEDNSRRAQLLTLPEFLSRFKDEHLAEAWLVAQRWPNGMNCPSCGSGRIAQPRSRRPTPYRCMDCLVQFSTRSHSAMRGSKLPSSVWVRAFHLSSTVTNPNLVGLGEVLPVSPKTAWSLDRRMHEAWTSAQPCLPGTRSGEIAQRSSKGPVSDGLQNTGYQFPLDATPEQLAQAFFRLPEGHEWQFAGGKYLKNFEFRRCWERQTARTCDAPDAPGPESET